MLDPKLSLFIFHQLHKWLYTTLLFFEVLLGRHQIETAVYFNKLISLHQRLGPLDMHSFKLDYLLIEVFPLCLKALLELKDLILYALLAGHDTLTIITDISLILVDLICVHA